MNKKAVAPLIWIGLILAGVLLVSNSELFAIFSPNKISYTTVRSLSGIELNKCWNKREVVSIDKIGNKYKIGWTWGCDCYKLYTPKNIDVTLYFWSDELDYKEVKDYSTYVINSLKKTDPYKNYNFAAVYQKDKNSYTACDQTAKIANHIVIGVTKLDSESYAGQAAFNFLMMSYKYKRNSVVLVHELSHVYDLEHVSYTTSGQFGFTKNPHIEYKNNYMLPLLTTSNNKFIQFQKDIIIATIENKLKKCPGTRTTCYPDINGDFKLLQRLKEYIDPLPINCPC